MSKFKFFNDTKRVVNIHPATVAQGCQCDESPIKPLEVREFILPEGTYAMVKMWDYGQVHGLQIFVSGQKD
jgi:hypothetical protein